MKKLTIFAICISIILFLNPELTFAKSSASRPVKILLKSIQYGKYRLASRNLDYKEISRNMMKKYWKRLSGEQKKETISSLKKLIHHYSFKGGNKLFKHLSSIIYGRARIRGNIARCKTTIIVYQNYKKKEIVVDFKLMKKRNKWKIVEMYTLGEGLFDGVYQDEIIPLVRKGGIEAVMKVIRKKVAKINIK